MNTRQEVSPATALAVLGIILAIGLLKANELFDFIASVELYVFDEKRAVLKVYTTALLAFILFSLSYLAFLTVAFDAVWETTKAQTDETTKSPVLTIALGRCLLTLAFANFAAFALAYGQSFNRLQTVLDDASKTSYLIDWSVTPTHSVSKGAQNP